MMNSGGKPSNETTIGGRRYPTSPGDWLHILELLLLVASAGMWYSKSQAVAEKANTTDLRVERIEHYLSSKDPSYWRLSKENE